MFDDGGGLVDLLSDVEGVRAVCSVVILECILFEESAEIPREGRRLN